MYGGSALSFCPEIMLAKKTTRIVIIENGEFHKMHCVLRWLFTTLSRKNLFTLESLSGAYDEFIFVVNCDQDLSHGFLNKHEAEKQRS